MQQGPSRAGVKPLSAPLSAPLASCPLVPRALHPETPLLPFGNFWQAEFYEVYPSVHTWYNAWDCESDRSHSMADSTLERGLS